MELGFSRRDDAVPLIVLVADPDNDTREMYATALSLDGFWVDQAATSADALVFASELKPNAIVTDVSFGGPLEGMELVRALWLEPRTADIPIVAVTCSPELLADSEDAFAAVLEKPVALDGLVEQVRRAMAQSADLTARGGRARARVAELLERSTSLLQKSHRLAVEFAQRPSASRPCPVCQRPLAWVERQALDGTLFDYYEPCPNRCGLFCYDHRLAEFVPLIR